MDQSPDLLLLDPTLIDPVNVTQNSTQVPKIKQFFKMILDSKKQIIFIL